MGITLVVAMFACNKNNDSNPEIETGESNYFPLTTGSYWVYNTYEIDSLSNEELKSENDTITIVGDTTINGHTFKVFYGRKYYSSTPEKFYYRNSSDFIIDDKGVLVFSQSNFTDTLYSEYIPDNNGASIHFYSKMNYYNSKLTMQVGVFDRLLNRNVFVDYLTFDPIRTEKLDILYAPNVGNVLHQYAYTHQLLTMKCYFEKRLVSYHIED